MLTAFISHPVCIHHEMHEGHPESPQRLHAIQDQLVASGLEMHLRHYDAPEATDEQILRVHTAQHLQRVVATSPQSGLASIDPDTAMNRHSLEAARRAAGAAVMAVEMVCAGDTHHAFCAVRPPGHHAERNMAMGFCFFNNVAVAAAHALDGLGLERVAVLDFDVHHGNGTEDCFHDDPRVLFCSSFQHPFYPYSSPHSDREHIIKTPLEAGARGALFRDAVTRTWLPALEAFAPQLIIISAGFDAHREDELGQLRFDTEDYYWFTHEVVQLAKRHCPGRVVGCLEGGYNLSALGRCTAAHIRALAEL